MAFNDTWAAPGETVTYHHPWIGPVDMTVTETLPTAPGRVALEGVAPAGGQLFASPCDPGTHAFGYTKKAAKKGGK